MARHISAVHLTQLPADVLIHIFLFLTPVDLMSLRKTCHKISEVTREWAIWAALLSCEHRAHQVSKSSFDLQHSSAEEIENAALQPYRLISSLLEARTHLRPLGTRILTRPTCISLGLDETDPPEDEADDPEFTTVALAPGGRYLFACSQSKVVSLWDLGPYADSMVGSQPLAIVDPIDSDGANVWLEEVSTNPQNPCDLRVIVRIHHRHAPAGTRTTFVVYDIDPSSSSPTFGFLSSTELIKPKKGLSERSNRAFNGRLFALLKQGALVVWDLFTDTVMTEQTTATAVTIINGYICVLNDSSQTTFFTITVSDGQISSLNRMETKHVLLQREDTGNSPELRVYPAQRSSSNDVLPVMLETPSDSDVGDVCTHTIIRYHPQDGQAKLLDSLESTDLGIVFDFRPHFANAFLLLGRFFDFSRVSLIANIIEIEAMRSGGSKRSNTVALFSSASNESIEEGGYDFCPLSGRAVVIGYGEIRVLDYLPSTRPRLKIH